ncbi:MAG: hypothetical protein K2Q24_04350 [Chitinophagaceae bacterium]|jgi:hypothetical protein|nr:hypothetical protein [Chitinophagaceae bacterium]
MAPEKYQIKFSRQLKLLWPCLIINIFCIAVWYYLIGSAAPLYLSILYFSFFFLVNLLPVLVLHTLYLSENKGSEFLFNRLEKTFIFQKNRVRIEADFSEIESLHYYGSYGRGSWYTFGEYEFCKIVLSNKQEIIVTCLLMKNVRETLEGAFSIKAEGHLRFIALLSK